MRGESQLYPVASLSPGSKEFAYECGTWIRILVFSRRTFRCKHSWPPGVHDSWRRKMGLFPYKVVLFAIALTLNGQGWLGSVTDTRCKFIACSWASEIVKRLSSSSLVSVSTKRNLLKNASRVTSLTIFLINLCLFWEQINPARLIYCENLSPPFQRNL